MHLYDDLNVALSAYTQDRDPANLQRAIQFLLSEIDYPQLQEAIITLPATVEEVNATLSKQDYLRVSMDSADATDGVEADKFVRVKAKDQKPDDVVALMKVAHLDKSSDGVIVLVPAVI